MLDAIRDAEICHQRRVNDLRGQAHQLLAIADNMARHTPMSIFLKTLDSTEATNAALDNRIAQVAKEIRQALAKEE